MSVDDSPRRHGPSPLSVADPSLNIDGFCVGENISRASLYNLWKRGKGPRYFYVGNSRRISHEARQQWRRDREAEAAEHEVACVANSKSPPLSRVTLMGHARRALATS
jgi:hypothetical protein